MSFRATHADEDALVQRVVAVLLVAEGLDQRRDVVRVARDDLHEVVVARDQRLVVDAPGVGLAEAELAPLREVPLRPRQALVALLVLVARRRTVDHDRGPLERFVVGERHLVPQPLEVRGSVLVGGQQRAPRHQVLEAGLVGAERRALVEGDLVDPHVVTEVGEQPDQRLTDRTGAYDVNDVLHTCVSPFLGGCAAAHAWIRKRRISTRRAPLSPPRRPRSGPRRDAPHPATRGRAGRTRRARSAPPQGPGHRRIADLVLALVGVDVPLTGAGEAREGLVGLAVAAP